MNTNSHLKHKIIVGLATGISAGAVICIYRILMNLCDTALNQFILPQLHNGNLLARVLWPAGLVCLALIVHGLIRLEPDAGGGGIPHAAKEVSGASDSRWWSVLITKIITAPLCALAGFSLGKTGPAVELGSMTAKGVRKARLRLTWKRKKQLPDPSESPADDTAASHSDNPEYIWAGSAAGLSALFNAPIAGMLFTCEKQGSNYGLNIILASFSAVIVSTIALGGDPIVQCHIPMTNWALYVLFALLGILLGILGRLYAKSLEFCTGKLTDNPKIPRLPFWIAIFLFAGAVGYFFPQITGGGSNMLGLLTGGESALATLGLLLLGKYLFSMLSSGSGLPGGTVFPLLTVGACLGQIFGVTANLLLPALQISPRSFLLAGMSGFFASVMEAPLTGIFLLCEFSCDYRNALPLAVVCLFSHLAAKRILR